MRIHIKDSRREDSEKRREHVRMEAQIRVMQPQMNADSHQKLEDIGKGSPLQSSECDPADTLTADFWQLEQWEDNFFYCFKPPNVW